MAAYVWAQPYLHQAETASSIFSSLTQDYLKLKGNSFLQNNNRTKDNMNTNKYKN